MKELIPLIEFILSWKYLLLESPINGNLKDISNLYNLQNEKLTSDSFMEYIHKINDLAPNTLTMVSSFNSSFLEWFNEFSLNILLLKIKQRVQPIASSNTPSKKEEKSTALKKQQPFDNFKSPLEFLNSILSQPLYTSISDEGSDVNGDGIITYKKLEYVLSKPTTISKLSHEKVKCTTPKKTFYNICNNLDHCYKLSEIIGLKYNSNLNFLKNNKSFKLSNQQKMKLSHELASCYSKNIHFLPIIKQQTEISLGDCSYLDTCHKINNCRYLHYFNLMPESHQLVKDMSKNSETENNLKTSIFTFGDSVAHYRDELPPQWINCDIRKIDFSILGKFAAVIADPAWDIHMSLPYGTCRDKELLALPVNLLQDEGIILLWVTARSTENGRDFLTHWGYKIVNELIWVKVNQLKKTICTGRTGHWLNHTKEHLIIGLKGNPKWLKKNIDPDVLVSSTRETSRKPDEIYGIVERLVGSQARKLEIFGRDHNTRPGWLTIGNQLNGTQIYEKEVQIKYDEWLEKNPTV